MTILISIVIFNVLPLFILLAGLCYYVQPICELDDSPAVFAWHEEVVSCGAQKAGVSVDIDVSAFCSVALDSFEQLARDLDAYKLDITGITAQPFTGQLVVVLSDIVSQPVADMLFDDVDVSHADALPAVALNGDSFAVPSSPSPAVPSIDQWLDEECYHLFVMAATEATRT